VESGAPRHPAGPRLVVPPPPETETPAEEPSAVAGPDASPLPPAASDRDSEPS